MNMEKFYELRVFASWSQSLKLRKKDLDILLCSKNTFAGRQIPLAMKRNAQPQANRFGADNYHYRGCCFNLLHSGLALLLSGTS